MNAGKRKPAKKTVRKKETAAEAPPRRALDGTWPAWLQENLDRKCDPEQLLGILLRNGFSPASIKSHMGSLFPEKSSFLEGIPFEALVTLSDITG